MRLIRNFNRLRLFVAHPEVLRRFAAGFILEFFIPLRCFRLQAEVLRVRVGRAEHHRLSGAGAASALPKAIGIQPVAPPLVFGQGRRVKGSVSEGFLRREQPPLHAGVEGLVMQLSQMGKRFQLPAFRQQMGIHHHIAGQMEPLPPEQRRALEVPQPDVFQLMDQHERPLYPSQALQPIRVEPDASAVGGHMKHLLCGRKLHGIQPVRAGAIRQNQAQAGLLQVPPQAFDPCPGHCRPFCRAVRNTSFCFSSGRKAGI